MDTLHKRTKTVTLKMIAGTDVLGPARLRVLDVVMRSGWTTMRDIAKELRCNHKAVDEHLHALRRRGLVTWEDGLCRTIRPTCRFIPAE